MLAFRRQHPETTRRGNIQVAFLIDLDAVESIFTSSVREIEKEFAVFQCAVRLHLATHYDLSPFSEFTHLVVRSRRLLTCKCARPVAYVQILLLGRQGD